MKTFLSSVTDSTRPLSQKLLLTSFISGYVLAIFIYKFFSPEVHQFLNSILPDQ
jgi:hypothetical protein